MPNPKPKGLDKMKELGRRGGQASGEKRHEVTLMKLLSPYAEKHGISVEPEVLLAGVEPERRPNRSGGSHDLDWRCSAFHAFNSIQRRMCGKCQAPAPVNGRLTRRALREKAAEHRVEGILRKHGL
jgi:hypothetical protein